MQRSCFLPDSRRPDQLDGKSLRSDQQLGGDGDKGETTARRGKKSSSITLAQQSSTEGGEELSVGSVGESGGVVPERKDVLGLVLHHILTEN